MPGNQTLLPVVSHKQPLEAVQRPQPFTHPDTTQPPTLLQANGTNTSTNT